VLPLPDEIATGDWRRRHRQFPDVPALSLQQAFEAAQRGAFIVDLRPALAFAAGHPAGAINLMFNKSNLVERARKLFAPDDSLIIIGDIPLIAQEAAQMLAEEGMTVAGYVQEPVSAWLSSGLPVEQIVTGDLDVLHGHVQDHDAVILDVREPFEWEKGVIPNGSTDIRLISLGEIKQRWRELPTDRTIVVVCESGTRASAVVSFLKRLGYSDLINIAPQGMSDYSKKYETVRPELTATT
jgi:hydroxyacylglutathione hydrolase